MNEQTGYTGLAAGLAAREGEVHDCRGGKPSASGMQRLSLCPGSWLAERAYADETSAAAEMGTRLHKHMEDGTTPDDATEAEAVEWCRGQEEWLATKYAGPAATECVTRENRWWDAKGKFSGQADVVFAADGIALVLDYKFGRVPVAAAANNMQLAALALLAFDNMEGLEVVFCGILQPFASRKEPRVVRYRRESVEELRGYFYRLLAEVEEPGARRVPGEEQCRYCKAKVECPACGGMVKSHATPAVSELWPDWTPEKKAEALRLASMAKKWAEAVERKAKGDLQSGAEIPGWCLSAGKSSFKINDTQGAFGQLNALIGLTGEEFAGCCTVKISALDKVVHKRLAEQAPEGMKQLVKKSAEWLRSALEDYGSVSTTDGSLKEC